MNDQLKLYRPMLLPSGTVWGLLAASFIIPFVAANDDCCEPTYEPEPPAPAPVKARPKLTVV